MTSSPAPIPANWSATSTAAVADASVRTGRPAQNCESARSNVSTHGPLVIWPERNTSATPAIVASSISGPANFSVGAAVIARLRRMGYQPHADDDETDTEPAPRGDRLAD